MLASLFLIGAFVTTPQMSVQAASQAIVEDGADGMTRTVNRMLGGIVSYVRWPGDHPAGARVMCVVGTPRLTDRLQPTMPGGAPVAVRRTSASAAMGSGCDILFIGRMQVVERQRLIAWVRGRAVLTVTDDDPACAQGAMFCLAARNTTLGFSVNLDAVARGQLRVDPRVLKIGQGEEGSP